MTTYRTVQGDTWDMIAFRKLGSTDHTDKLMNVNISLVGKYFTFPDGVLLNLPDIVDTGPAAAVPWKRVSG